MEGPVGQKNKQLELALVSVSELSSSSSAAQSKPVVARFSADSGVAELRFQQESESISAVNVDLRTAKLFRMGPVQSVCISEGADSSETSYSRGVTIQFRNEEESKAFHCTFEQRRKEALQGKQLANGTVSDARSKFDDKIEPSSAKMYFHYYGQLLHQQNMLQDYVRTGTYYAAVIENRSDFIGRIVVDVGAGSGILSLFAAQAGAKHVYAVEASEMAEYARKLIAGNPQLSQRITVVKGKVEEVELPEAGPHQDTDMWVRRFSSCASARRVLKQKKWDALVIGAGHNGLIAATYLARGGLSVAVLERRHIIGGAAVTEELIPGFKFSRCSYLHSLLRPSIIKELQLGRHGLRLLKPMAQSFTPCRDGRYLLLWPSDEQNYEEISKFSKRDANAYPRYESQLHKFTKLMDFLLDSHTPETLHGDSSLTNRLRDKLHKSVFWTRCLKHALSLGQKDIVDFMDLLLSPTSKVLNRWFESDVLKAALAADAIIGSMASIHAPGSGYVLLHHVIGETDGERNIWSHVEGGMGSVSLAISNAAKEAGVEIVTNAEVSKLMIEDSGTVHGVLLAEGEQLCSSVVLSNATPYKTFMELVPQNFLPDDFVRAIKYSDYSSGTTKINVAVDELPQFQSCKLSHPEVGPQHTATIHIGSESMEEIGSACQDALNGLPSQRPVMEMTIPSSLDKSISPSGKHVVSLFTQYTPYSPSDGSWQDPTYRESYAQRCFNLIDEYAPSFSSSVIGYDMLTPLDLEREFGLTGGNIFHGAMNLDSLFLMRPVKQWSGHRTPIKGLYLCGSGSHPGGGVMGAPGRNAVHVVLQDIKKRYC